MTPSASLFIVAVVSILHLTNGGGHHDRHRIIIHVPYKIKHIYHTHTVLKHIQKDHGDKYELLGYSVGKPEDIKGSSHDFVHAAANIESGGHEIVGGGYDFGGVGQDFGGGHDLVAGEHAVIGGGYDFGQGHNFGGTGYDFGGTGYDFGGGGHNFGGEEHNFESGLDSDGGSSGYDFGGGYGGHVGY